MLQNLMTGDSVCNLQQHLSAVQVNNVPDIAEETTARGYHPCCNFLGAALAYRPLPRMIEATCLWVLSMQSLLSMQQGV